MTIAIPIIIESTTVLSDVYSYYYDNVASRCAISNACSATWLPIHVFSCVHAWENVMYNK